MEDNAFEDEEAADDVEMSDELSDEEEQKINATKDGRKKKVKVFLIYRLILYYI